MTWRLLKRSALWGSSSLRLSIEGEQSRRRPLTFWACSCKRDPQSGELMQYRQLSNEILTLIVAGHETTASTLNWTWYLISQHPEVERKTVK